MKRENPASWKGLVQGARFMDRFIPTTVKKVNLTNETWGVEAVRPRDLTIGIEDPKWSYWGGDIIQDAAGLYHMYVCRWPENSPKGHMSWWHAETIRATSKSLRGPFVEKEVIGPGYNTTTFLTKDGGVAVYVHGRYFYSKSLTGPWEQRKFKFDPRDRRIIEGLSNVVFTPREDGSVLALCRGGGIWVSETGTSPFEQVSNKRIYPEVAGAFEDPAIWRDYQQYHMIVNDWHGRVAYYARSLDGIHWVHELGAAYEPKGLDVYSDGTVVDWYKYERIQIFQDKLGRAIQANFAVIDFNKWKDLKNDIHNSKNIGLSLTVDRLVTILNKKPLTAAGMVRVRIQAEKGFNPHTDVDVKSLHFGASNEVSVGRGARPISSVIDGADLIVEFPGRGVVANLPVEDYACKILGKTTNGKLFVGFAVLPGTQKITPILSSKRPVLVKGSGIVTLDVKNYGQVASKVTDITCVCTAKDGSKYTFRAKVPTLKPYETSTVLLSKSHIPKTGTYQVVILSDQTELFAGQWVIKK